jgi:NitT/TauT family transport system ATP-binding protein
MAELIRVENVRVAYPIQGAGTKIVLDNVNLTIEPGEFISVVGQTGCGKSTLLRLILGSEKPAAGHVLIEGKEIDRPDRDRGYVPQKYSLFPDKTVLGNVSFGPVVAGLRLWSYLTHGYWKRRGEVHGEARQYIKSMGLDASDAGKYPDQLSGGMQQRVAIAQALIMKPKILLMDEAFSALDPGTRADMQKLIRTIWAETGTTILFVTHNLAEAIYLGSRVVVLGKQPDREGSRVVLDLKVPTYIRQESGYPRQDEMGHLIRTIEDAALNGRLEQELAEFGG